MKHYLKIFLVMILGTSAVVATGQENDDLYFTKKDRVKQKKKFSEVAQQYNQQPSQAISSEEELSFLGQQFRESNPVEEGFVSPESLEFYQPEKTQEDYKAANYSAENQYQNSNFSNPQETFVDNTIPQQVIVNNYYNDNWNNWNQWNRPRWSFGLGFNNWGGSFWNVSYGNSWGNPWYDPFWDPWGPAWGWNAGWGWNSWAYNPWGWNAGWGWRGGFFGSAWCPPLYGNYYGRPVYVVGNGNEASRGRRVVRGSRNARGSSSYRSNRSSSGRRAAVANESNSRADYSRQQANYLNKARSSRYNSSNARGSSNGRVNNVNSRSSNATNSSFIRNNRSSNSNNSFNRSSNNSRNNRSFSTPPARSSRGSSARPSRPSRSSGSVGRSRSSSSRSSGSRSSGSRSSSGRSSSKRGRN